MSAPASRTNARSSAVNLPASATRRPASWALATHAASTSAGTRLAQAWSALVRRVEQHALRAAGRQFHETGGARPVIRVGVHNRDDAGVATASGPRAAHRGRDERSEPPPRHSGEADLHEVRARGGERVGRALDCHLVDRISQRGGDGPRDHRRRRESRAGRRRCTAPSAPASGSFASMMSAPPASAADASVAFATLTSSRIAGYCKILRVDGATPSRRGRLTPRYSIIGSADDGRRRRSRRSPDVACS